MLDVVTLKAGDFIEQPSGSTLFQNLLRSRPGVETAFCNRFVQDSGEPRFGVGVVWTALAIYEVGDAQSAARPRFDFESTAQASARLCDLERAAVGDAFDLRVVIVEF